MTVYKAANPRHVRQFDTDSFWWLEEAWNERSMQWWASADDIRGRRITALLQFAPRMHQSGIPELSPPAEWMAEAIQRHPATRIELDASLSHLPLAYQVAVAYNAVEEKRIRYEGTTQGEFLSLADPAANLAAGMQLTEEMFEEGRLFRTAKGRRGIPRRLGNRGTFRSAIPAVARGMLRNPQLPSFDRPAKSNGELSTWQACLLQAYKADTDLLVAQGHLMTNPGASQEDLLFAAEMVLPSVMEEEERGLRKRGQLSLDSHSAISSRGGMILEDIAKHPNFVSHPGVDEIYPPHEVVLASKIAALPATAKSALSETLGLRSSVLESRAAGEFVQPRDSLEAVYETILNTPEAEVRAWHLNLVKEYMSEVSESTKYEVNRLALLSESACLLGATLAGLDEMMDGISDQVPLEWLLELLGS